MGRNDCFALELRNKKAQSFQHPNFGAKFVNDAPVLKERARGSRAADDDDHTTVRITAGGRLSRAALAAWQPFGRDLDRFTG